MRTQIVATTIGIMTTIGKKSRETVVSFNFSFTLYNLNSYKNPICNPVTIQIRKHSFSRWDNFLIVIPHFCTVWFSTHLFWILLEIYIFKIFSNLQITLSDEERQSHSWIYFIVEDNGVSFGTNATEIPIYTLKIPWLLFCLLFMFSYTNWYDFYSFYFNLLYIWIKLSILSLWRFFISVSNRESYMYFNEQSMRKA